MSNETRYNSTCDHNGNWTTPDGCSLRYCEPLNYDGSVEIEILEAPIKGIENILNSTVRASCRKEGEDFDFGFNLLSVEYHCGYRFNDIFI